MALSAIHEGADDIAQGRERQVNLRGLLEPNSGGLCLALTLGAGQIDQIELASLEPLLSLHL